MMNYNKNMVEPDQIKKKNSATRLILLTVVIAFAVMLVIINQSKKKSEKEAVIPKVVIPTPIVLTEGSFSLQTVAKEQTVGNKAIELELMADSNQKSIVGYDIVMTYQKGAVEILSVDSLLADFEIFPLEKSDQFIITGVKKLESRTPVIFNNTAILKLTVIPKKAGDVTLQVIDKIGLEKSQMIDEQTNILMPLVGKLKLK